MNDAICLITGASRGIGRATALLAGKQGYHVCVNYRQQSSQADAVVKAITRSGGRAFAVQADVSEESEVIKLFDLIDKAPGRLSVLVNNVGITHPLGTVDSLAASTIENLFKLNVGAYFLCAREAIKRLSLRHGGNGGSIVNVSSVASRLGGANEYVDYAASKGAIDSMTIGLAKELAQEKIRVNGVRPGIIKTDIHTLSGMPDRAERRAHLIPMQRAGEPIEVARAILWLASAEASYITGSLLDVSGGL